MKTIQLTQNKSSEVDDDDYEYINNFKWRTLGNTKIGYHAVREIWNHGNRYSEHMHRIIMEREIGRKLNKEEKVDHIDGNGLNNKKQNLRICSQYENCLNSKIRNDNKSGYKGIYYDKQRKSYQVRVTENKKTHMIRTKSLNEAILLRTSMAKKLHGEFYRER